MFTEQQLALTNPEVITPEKPWLIVSGYVERKGRNNVLVAEAAAALIRTGSIAGVVTFTDCRVANHGIPIGNDIENIIRQSLTQDCGNMQEEYTVGNFPIHVTPIAQVTRQESDATTHVLSALNITNVIQLSLDEHDARVRRANKRKMGKSAASRIPILGAKRVLAALGGERGQQLLLKETVDPESSAFGDRERLYNFVDRLPVIGPALFDLAAFIEHDVFGGQKIFAEVAYATGEAGAKLASLLRRA